MLIAHSDLAIFRAVETTSAYSSQAFDTMLAVEDLRKSEQYICERKDTTSTYMRLCR